VNAGDGNGEDPVAQEPIITVETIVVTSTADPDRAATSTLAPTVDKDGAVAVVSTVEPTAVPDTDTPTPPTATVTARALATTPSRRAEIISNVWTRSGPGLNYPVVGALERGDRVTVQGRDRLRVWYLVQQEDGDLVWVTADFIQAANSLLDAVQVAATIPPTPTIAATVPPASAPTPVPAPGSSGSGPTNPSPASTNTPEPEPCGQPRQISIPTRGRNLDDGLKRWLPGAGDFELIERRSEAE
jgi:hypothetical protein